MPNYVRTRLSFEGKEERIKELFNLVRTETVNEDDTILFDFNKIIPMPSALDILSCSVGEQAAEYLLYKCGYRTSKDRSIERMEMLKEKSPEEFDEAIKLGKQYLRNVADYGCATWYEWHIRNWGTKWPAGEIVVNENSVEFDTAWSFPTPIVLRLSELFPDINISYLYADEDCGYNTGRGKFVAGKCETEEYPQGGSREAYEIYFDTHPDSRKYFLFNDVIGNYEYNDKYEED
jgi:hypothetical protein